jgi:hypothetical protein
MGGQGAGVDAMPIIRLVESSAGPRRDNDPPMKETSDE